MYLSLKKRCCLCYNKFSRNANDSFQLNFGGKILNIMGKQTTDFRYNTGATKVPWAAVGENYNVHDLMEIIRFLMQGQGKEYEDALEAVWTQVKKLDALATPPGKLSLGSKVEAAEAACNEYLKTESSTFVANATAGFEIAYKYANLKAGDEVIVPAITFVATMAYPLAIGCKLVFADVDPRTINMDPEDHYDSSRTYGGLSR